MVIKHTKQTEISELAITESGYQTDQTDQNKGIAPTEQTEKTILPSPNRPKYGYLPERNMANN